MMSKDRRPIPAAAGALALAGALVLSGCGLIGQPQTSSAELSEWFTVTSPVFRDGRDLPTRYGCTKYPGGVGATPPLRWSGTPAGTRSFAIVMDDPDAATGAHVHWVIAGIDGTTQQLVEGARLPKTVEGLNTSEKVGYTPPCPPEGERHRFRFTIYALDTEVPFRNGAPLKESLGAIAKHTVGRGRITGNFGSN
ncbi:YbhB/YbcL family Raf kinase inhibitor-like protein [Actinomadura viridis]|uniref:Raf kinase inhibitor-like YbhB/YbcL family protein n=1 Tax=Actinomadura viridis TaxID=58110 RepID=A0A931DJJ0_9ACTN|nr:YbhB/YbcL family Raf kinase inhibitor-like protein [Actinomadura viridis]MBG6091180.1 Raf kinase inhibitor-like YbhB/YbcL family protein [Actinomadura viridis]